MATSFRTALLGSALIFAAQPVYAQAARPVSAPVSDPIVWQIDRGHSELSFTIRHLIGRVRGTFADWSGTITTDPKNLEAGSVDVAIKTASIDTNHDKRDSDLRGADFFNVTAFPTMSFKSRKVEVSGETLKVYGDLTIRDVTRAVVLEGSFLGLLPAGEKARARIAFEASTSINRLDYGLKWNRMVESGPYIGDDVKIEMVIEAVQAPPAGAPAP